jgi:hypothetical protein
VLRVSEHWQGEDLNGDGDEKDAVVHAHRLSTAETRNLRVAGGMAFDGYPLDPTRDWLALLVAEADQGGDLNGDGDTKDRVVHVHKLPADETVSLGLAGLVAWVRCQACDVSQAPLVLLVSEADQGADLNGDGDMRDHVLHVHRPSTGETANVRLAGYPEVFPFGGDASGDWLILEAYEAGQNADLNGDGDKGDMVLHLADLKRLMSGGTDFVRGEANADGALNLSDGVFILSWLFRGGEEPPCLDAADSDDDGVVSLTDAVALLGHLFLGQAPLPAPGPSCGADETPDALDCRCFLACDRRG